MISFIMAPIRGLGSLLFFIFAAIVSSIALHFTKLAFVSLMGTKILNVSSGMFGLGCFVVWLFYMGVCYWFTSRE